QSPATQAPAFPPLRRRTPPPFHRCRASRLHDLLIIGRGRAADLRDHFVGRRIDRVDERATVVSRPACAAGPRAGIDRLQIQSREYFVHDAFSHNCRWWPALPDTTTSEEMSFVPPGA